MKKYLLIAIILPINILSAQMIGDTRSNVLELQEGHPCENSKNYLMYCSETQDRLIYTFNSSNYLYRITQFKYVVNSQEGQYLINQKIAEYQRLYNAKPLIMNGFYTYLLSDSQMISFSTGTNQWGSYFSTIELNTDLAN